MMTPLRNLFLTLVCLLPCGARPVRASNMKEAALVRKTEQVVTEFFKVVSDSKIPYLTERTVPVDRAMRGQLISIQIPPDDPGKPLHAAAFTLDKDNRPHLELKASLIELYPRYKSFVFAVLMHEVSHANDYLKDPEAFIARPKEDRLERYLYEMDATFMEAIFIRDVSRPKGWKLSAFETYLLESLEKDNLASVSMVFQVVDMDFVYTFYKARSGSEALQISGGKLVEAGKSMKKDFLRSEKGREWERYRCLVSIRTFVTLGTQLASTLVSHKNPDVDPKDTIEKHVPGFDSIILELQDLLTKHQEELEYRTSLVKRFNDSFKSK